MDIGETAKFTVEFVLSNDGGELPNKTEITEMLWSAVTCEAFRDIETLAIEVTDITGEL